MSVHQLAATPYTVHWGHFDNSLPPVLEVAAGDLVRVETVTAQAGDAPDLMMDGEIARIFEQVTVRGPGPHLLTGPIAVAGAEPGDTLVVRILAVEPRLPWGVNLAGHWGLLYPHFKRERATVYRIDVGAGLARPTFAYDWTTTPLANRPGTVVDPGTVERQPALPGVAVPLRPHFGVIGLAPEAPGRYSTVPPGDHGGNIDNWRIGAGATMYYPVAVPGALVSVGDGHMGQGDGEVNGTAIEASLNGLLQLDLLHGFPFGFPVLETADAWCVHGFGDDLDEAMMAAAMRLLQLLTVHHGLSEDDAYSLMSVACDFTVTQVVDGRLGVHGIVAKRLFVGPG